VTRRSSPIDTPHESAVVPEVARGDVLLAIGNGQFLSHRLDGGELVIGRDAGCGFVIDHHGLSRRHAVLQLGARVTVQDLGSTNGTRVAGRTLRGGEPVELDDTGFRIGPYSFVIVSKRAGASLPASGRDMLQVDDPTRAGASGLVRSFAASDVNILIAGETGVGKEVLATTLHELSGRAGPLIQLNCAALNPTLLESELFGHEKGAFTGATEKTRGLIEAADGGTVMLDEIGELSLAIQAKLLRVIERREVLRLGSTRPIKVDVRFIAATHRDLVAEVARGAFREDLFYRLDGVGLTIPPLRARRGAIIPLAIRFLEATPAAAGTRVQLSAEVVAALQAHPWPGNVRELKAVIERAAVLAGGAELSVRHLTFRRQTHTPPPQVLAPTAPAAASVAPPVGTDPALELDAEQRVDRARVMQALADAAGNQTRAAKQLGISRTTMITKLRIYKIPRPSGSSRR
jgi:DNA-binding NtrC family response regulator